MNSRDRARLRTKLRQLNIEYSALVRNRSGDGRFIRMTALRLERRAIMSLLFGDEPTKHGAASRQPMSALTILHAVE
jgi:hypothetical protein